MRLPAVLLALLVPACAHQRALPVRYDLDSPSAHPVSGAQLHANIALAPIQAPSWLRTRAVLYRLDYETPALTRAYAEREWTAPPTEMLTLRLRERIAAANTGFTLERLPEKTAGYRLSVTLENFSQTFRSPQKSECVMTLSATVLRDGDEVVAQQIFRSEGEAPSANAAGAVEGLAHAADANFEQILAWLSASLPQQPAVARTR